MADARIKGKPGPLTCYFWVRDQFLPATECTAAAASVLLTLAGYASPDGSNVRPGKKNLMRVTKLDRDTVRNAIKFWKSHASGVLVEVVRGMGSGHTSVFQIIMRERGVPSAPSKDGKGVPSAPLEEKGADSTEKRGGEGADVPAPTVLPKKNTEEEEAASAAFAAIGQKPFGKELRKVWPEMWRTAGPDPDWIDRMERTVNTIGTKNTPSLFFQIKRKVETGELKIKPYIAPLSPDAIAKAEQLWSVAKDHDWTKEEFAECLRSDYGIRPLTVENIAKLSEENYQAALLRFQRYPPERCEECGEHGQCEHKRAAGEQARKFLLEQLEKLKGG